MKTHLSFGGYCVRWAFKNTLPDRALRVGVGRLLSPNSHYVDAPYVTVYWCPGIGYGYT